MSFTIEQSITIDKPVNGAWDSVDDENEWRRPLDSVSHDPDLPRMERVRPGRA